MALTKAAVDGLSAKRIGHDDLSGVVLPTGLIKTSRGLIARPSTSKTDCRTGKLIGDDDQELEQDDGTQTTQAVEEVAVQPKRRSRRSRVQQVEPAPVRPQPKRLDFSLEGFGSIATQYAHVYPGDGVLVLGLNEFSYVPAVAHMDENNQIKGVVSVAQYPGRLFVYGGLSFKDDSGTKYIILAEVK